MNESLDEAIDQTMRECGFLTHEDRRISLAVLRDAYLLCHDREIDRGVMGTQIGNLKNEYRDKWMARQREADAAHFKRLNPQ